MLGTFENTSGTLVVSDPCYALDAWCLIEIKNTKEGTWKAHVEYKDEGGWGIRCANIMALHESEKTPIWDFIGKIGVDSGQAGIFDLAVYRRDDLVEVKENTRRPDMPWYSSCGDLTLSDAQAGVIPGGAVASSGFGDGSYEVFIHRSADGEIAGVLIIFIEDEDEDEYLVPDDDERGEEDEFLVPNV